MLHLVCLICTKTSMLKWQVVVLCGVLCMLNIVKVRQLICPEHFLNSSRAEETHLALMSACHMTRSWGPTESERSREATWFHSSENTSPHLTSPQPPADGWKKKKSMSKKLNPSYILWACHTSLLTLPPAAHYAWLLNRRWCIFMSQSQLMC